MIKVISLGGSIIISKDDVDTDFLKNFIKTIKEWLDSNEDNKIIIVTGGGSLARKYQQANLKIGQNIDNINQDKIGIAATNMNATLLKACFGEEYCKNEIISNPNTESTFLSKVIIASGWKPGFSTDYCAILLAKKFEIDIVINLSNIEKIYSDDPNINPEATPIDELNWDEYRKLITDEWRPGLNTPFDPIASKSAQENNIEVYFASGKDLENIKNILYDKEFFGSIIKNKYD